MPGPLGQHPLGRARMLLIHFRPQASSWGQGPNRQGAGGLRRGSSHSPWVRLWEEAVEQENPERPRENSGVCPQ